MLRFFTSRRGANLARLLILPIVAAIPPAAVARDFQNFAVGTCDAGSCLVDFPIAPKGKLQEIRKASCYLRASAASASQINVFQASLALTTAEGQTPVTVFLPLPVMSQYTDPTSGASVNIYENNEDIQLVLKPRQRVTATTNVLPPAIAEQFACHISGKITP